MKKLIISLGKLPAKQQNALAALIYVSALFGLCYMVLHYCGKG